MEIQIQVHSASYREESIEEFRFNPLIEALPATIEFDEVGDYLMFRPSYEETDRQLSTSTRMNVTQRIALVHQPTEQEVDVYYRISRCIRWGYVGRNPLSPAYVAQLAAGYSASVNGSGLNYSAIYNPRTFGFSLLGVSGIGKTSAVEKILSLYPQVIKHELYHGYPINELQISWMKLDCTHDGSLKGICMEFFEMLDNLVGTEYYKQYTSQGNAGHDDNWHVAPLHLL